MKVALEQLTETGLIEARGTGRGRFYILSSRVYKEQNNVAGYIRQTGIDSMRYSELILELTDRQGYVQRKDVANLLSVSLPQAYRLIKKLVDSHRLVQQGIGKQTHYVLGKK